MQPFCQLYSSTQLILRDQTCWYGQESTLTLIQRNIFITYPCENSVFVYHADEFHDVRKKILIMHDIILLIIYPNKRCYNGLRITTKKENKTCFASLLQLTHNQTLRTIFLFLPPLPIMICF